MKKKICYLTMILGFLAFLPTNAWGIKVKLRLDLPLGGSYAVKRIG